MFKIVGGILNDRYSFRDEELLLEAATKTGQLVFNTTDRSGIIVQKLFVNDGFRCNLIIPVYVVGVSFCCY